MSKISWYKKQKDGIKIQEQNDNLSQEYYQNAEESLKVLKSIKETKSNMWLSWSLRIRSCNYERIGDGLREKQEV